MIIYTYKYTLYIKTLNDIYEKTIFFSFLLIQLKISFFDSNCGQKRLYNLTCSHTRTHTFLSVTQKIPCVQGNWFNGESYLIGVQLSIAEVFQGSSLQRSRETEWNTHHSALDLEKEQSSDCWRLYVNLFFHVPFTGMFLLEPTGYAACTN